MEATTLENCKCVCDSVNKVSNTVVSGGDIFGWAALACIGFLLLIFVVIVYVKLKSKDDEDEYNDGNGNTYY